MKLTSLELCAGAGGQAIGLEQAGFEHIGLVEIDEHCRQTLSYNRPKWELLEPHDLRKFRKVASRYRGIDLLAGGLPCPPFSIAGKQLGARDERNLFPDMLAIVEAVEPQAVLIENVKGLAGANFSSYRSRLITRFESLGFAVQMKLIHSSDFGVPQLRPRFIIVALRKEWMPFFRWPDTKQEPKTVGETLFSQMASKGWLGAEAWRLKANSIAPTIVGGSKKHGGPDLGPTRAKRAWAELGVNGHSIADDVPGAEFAADALPRLTVDMVALLQGFPPGWKIAGKKTNAYRQIGNAFPPPVAKSLGMAISDALSSIKQMALSA